jgi:ABC-type transport system substrate-binding protein
MTRTVHRFASVACAAAAVSVLAPPLGCDRKLASPIGDEPRDDSPPRRGGTLHLATMVDVRSLDPAGLTDSVALAPLHLMFAGLVDLDEHAQVVADLAERWSVEDGGRTYRFFLRRGVQMHDGAELTAEDVKRSVERALHPSTPDPNASYFEGIVGYGDYAAGRTRHLGGVEVDGPYAVTFRLSAPDATFLPMMTMHSLRPVCQSAGDRFDDAWTPCGAGPFMLPPGGLQRGTGLRLVRFAGYFRPGLPYLDAVEWAFGVQPLAQRFRFESGELDVVRDLSQADLLRYSADPRWKPFSASEGDTSEYGELLNTRMPPFDNVEIRRAVAAAIDWTHVRLLEPTSITLSPQPIPPGIPGHDASVPGQQHDLAAALEHMKRAGHPFDPQTGRGGWPASIVVPVYDQGLDGSVAQLVEQDLKKIGLRLDLRLVSWQTLLAIRDRPDGAAMAAASWSMDYPDPSSFFDPLFTTAAIPPAGANDAFYSNPRVDELVALAHRDMDPPRRGALYREAAALLCDEAPWAFGYSAHVVHLHHPYVRGYAPHPVWPLDATKVWLDRPSDPLRGGERPLGRVLP